MALSRIEHAFSRALNTLNKGRKGDQKHDVYQPSAGSARDTNIGHTKETVFKTFQTVKGVRDKVLNDPAYQQFLQQQDDPYHDDDEWPAAPGVAEGVMASGLTPRSVGLAPTPIVTPRVRRASATSYTVSLFATPGTDHSSAQQLQQRQGSSCGALPPGPVTTGITGTATASVACCSTSTSSQPASSTTFSPLQLAGSSTKIGSAKHSSPGAIGSHAAAASGGDSGGQAHGTAAAEPADSHRPTPPTALNLGVLRNSIPGNPALAVQPLAGTPLGGGMPAAAGTCTGGSGFLTQRSATGMAASPTSARSQHHPSSPLSLPGTPHTYASAHAASPVANGAVKLPSLRLGTPPPGTPPSRAHSGLPSGSLALPPDAVPPNAHSAAAAAAGSVLAWSTPRGAPVPSAGVATGLQEQPAAAAADTALGQGCSGRSSPMGAPRPGAGGGGTSPHAPQKRSSLCSIDFDITEAPGRWLDAGDTAYCDPDRLDHANHTCCGSSGLDTGHSVTSDFCASTPPTLSLSSARGSASRCTAGGRTDGSDGPLPIISLPTSAYGSAAAAGGGAALAPVVPHAGRRGGGYHTLARNSDNSLLPRLPAPLPGAAAYPFLGGPGAGGGPKLLPALRDVLPEREGALLELLDAEQEELRRHAKRTNNVAARSTARRASVEMLASGAPEERVWKHAYR